MGGQATMDEGNQAKMRLRAASAGPAFRMRSGKERGGYQRWVPDGGTVNAPGARRGVQHRRSGTALQEAGTQAGRGLDGQVLLVWYPRWYPEAIFENSPIGP